MPRTGAFGILEFLTQVGNHQQIILRKHPVASVHHIYNLAVGRDGILEFVVNGIRLYITDTNVLLYLVCGKTYRVNVQAEGTFLHTLGHENVSRLQHRNTLARNGRSEAQIVKTLRAYQFDVSTQ